MSTYDMTDRSMETKNIASQKNKVAVPMLLLKVTRQRDTSKMEKKEEQRVNPRKLTSTTQHQKNVDSTS